MKTVIVINDGGYGLIGVAKDYKSALTFLLNEHWIDDNTEVCSEDDGGFFTWKKLSQVLGEDWRDKMMKWNVSYFNYYWEGTFHLFIENVIETE